jgi:hypothetical protein
MGRSILARSDKNGLDFKLLYEVSRSKFINVPTMIVDTHEHGLPGEGPQLVTFGSGRYRSSDVYLAVKPVANSKNRVVFCLRRRTQPTSMES